MSLSKDAKVPKENRELLEAVISGSLDNVKSLVTHDESQETDESDNVFGPMDFTLILPEAVIHGHADIVRLLIDNGADMHYFDKITPLMVTAVLRRHIEVFRVLLANCKNINFEFKRGNIAHAAVKIKSLDVLNEIVKYPQQFLLFDKQDEVNQRTPLHEAVFVISGGKFPEAKTPDLEKSYQTLFGQGVFNISLHNAPEPSKETVEKLLESGSTVAPMSWDTVVPVSIDTELVKFFLVKQCNPNTRDRNLRTPLHDAAKAGKMDIIILLINAGASLYYEDSKGHLPWTEAVDAGYENLAALLLKDEDMYNVVHSSIKNCNHAFVAISNSVKCVQYLIKRGMDFSDTRLIDNEGVTPLTKSVQIRNAHMASLFVRFSPSNINVKTSAQYTALNYALDAWENREDTSWERVLDDMIKHGADVNLTVGVHNVHVLMQREYLMYPWRLNWVLRHSPDLNIKSKEGWFLFEVVVHHAAVHRPAHIGVKVLLTLLNHGMHIPEKFMYHEAHKPNTTLLHKLKMSPTLEALKGRHIVLAYLLYLAGCRSPGSDLLIWNDTMKSRELQNMSEHAVRLLDYLTDKECQPLSLQDASRLKILRCLPPGNVTQLGQKLPLPVELRRRLNWEHDIDCKPKDLEGYYRVVKEMLLTPDSENDSPNWDGYVLAPDVTFEL